MTESNLVHSQNKTLHEQILVLLLGHGQIIHLQLIVFTSGGITICVIINIIMFNSKTQRLLLSIAFMVAVAFASAGETFADYSDAEHGADYKMFTGRLSAEFETGYLSTSGTLCDTRPTALQNLDWAFHFGDYGRLYGYGAFLSMLHDKQHELHRPAFNEFEGGVFYGYD